MGDIINNLTQAEILAIRERALEKRSIRMCLWCQKEMSMRKDQKFCCSNCRALFSKYSTQILYDRLLSEQVAWTQEREGLLREISELRHELVATKATQQ